MYGEYCWRRAAASVEPMTFINVERTAICNVCLNKYIIRERLEYFEVRRWSYCTAIETKPHNTRTQATATDKWDRLLCWHVWSIQHWNSWHKNDLEPRTHSYNRYRHRWWCFCGFTLMLFAFIIPLSDRVQVNHSLKVLMFDYDTVWIFDNGCESAGKYDFYLKNDRISLYLMCQE